MLADRHPAGAKVLVIGAPWLDESVTAGWAGAGAAGRRTNPVAVVQGHSPDTGWRNWPRPASRCGPAPTGSPATSTPLCRPTAGCCPATARWWPRWSPPPGCTRGWPASPNARCWMPPSAWSAAAPAGRRRPAGHRHRLRGRRAASPSLMVLHRRLDGRRSAGRRSRSSAHLPGLRPARAGRGGSGRAHPGAVVDRSSLEWTVDSDRSSLVLSAEQGGDGAVSDAAALRALAMLTAAAWASGLDRCPRARPGRRGRAGQVRPSRSARRIPVSGRSRTRWTERAPGRPTCRPRRGRTLARASSRTEPRAPTTANRREDTTVNQAHPQPGSRRAGRRSARTARDRADRARSADDARPGGRVRPHPRLARAGAGPHHRRHRAAGWPSGARTAGCVGAGWTRSWFGAATPGPARRRRS